MFATKLCQNHQNRWFEKTTVHCVARPNDCRRVLLLRHQLFFSFSYSIFPKAFHKGPRRGAIRTLWKSKNYINCVLKDNFKPSWKNVCLLEGSLCLLGTIWKQVYWKSRKSKSQSVCFITRSHITQSSLHGSSVEEKPVKSAANRSSVNRNSVCQNSVNRIFMIWGL